MYENRLRSIALGYFQPKDEEVELAQAEKSLLSLLEEAKKKGESESRELALILIDRKDSTFEAVLFQIGVALKEGGIAKQTAVSTLLIEGHFDLVIAAAMAEALFEKYSTFSEFISEKVNLSN